MGIATGVQIVSGIYDRYWLGQTQSEKTDLTTKGDIRLTNLFFNSNIASWGAKSLIALDMISTIQDPSGRASTLFRNGSYYAVWLPTCALIDHLTWAIADPLYHFPVLGRWFHSALFESVVDKASYVFNGAIKIAADFINKASVSTDGPQMTTAFTAAKVAIPVFLAIMARKRIHYDISLILSVVQGVFHKQDWWSQADDQLYLSGIPLSHQATELSQLGIRHVIRVLDDFEMESGVIQPYEWPAKQVSVESMLASGLISVTPKLINQGVCRLRDAREKHHNHKILIHCETGNGRSAAIVVAEMLANKISSEQRSVVIAGEYIERSLEECIATLQKKRPQIHLNADQQQAIIDYIEEYV